MTPPFHADTAALAPLDPPGRRAWPLRAVLIVMLLAATGLTFLLVGVGLLWLRLPRQDAELQAQVDARVQQLVRREERMLAAVELQLQLVAAALQRLPRDQADAWLDAAVGDGNHLRSLAWLNREHHVLAVGLPARHRAMQPVLKGLDLSRTQAVLRTAARGSEVVWGAMAVSALSGELTLAAVLPLADGEHLWAELPLNTLLAGALANDHIPVATHTVEPLLLLVDGNGEVMADSDGNRAVGRVNLMGSPVLDVATQAGRGPQLFEGQRVHVAAARSTALDWTFVARVPAGLAHPQVRGTIWMVVGAFAAAFLVGVALAPWWARRLVRWLDDAVALREPALAGAMAPRHSPVQEFNELAGRLNQANRALRSLNLELESRVAQRTTDLAEANDTLRQTLENLQSTRDELLRAEKQAALGGLVAGVAHELNTPLGNARMAVSTLRDELQQFRTNMADGLTRAALTQFLEGVDQATSLSERNLLRAADLVNSFKQVAVDQASAQRRPFLLDEVVQEILLTLKPGFSRTGFELRAEVDADLELDSYPGALGQILSNLVTNARVHGFDGRSEGTVEVIGRRIDAESVEVQVRDDGGGIAPELLTRVFDPFFTTRMGRGGTGLGLHIAHNAAVHVLGGRLTVASTLGEGTCFTLRLPVVAPHNSARAELTRTA